MSKLPRFWRGENIQIIVEEDQSTIEVVGSRSPWKKLCAKIWAYRSKKIRYGNLQEYCTRLCTRVFLIFFNELVAYFDYANSLFYINCLISIDDRVTTSWMRWSKWIKLFSFFQDSSTAIALMLKAENVNVTCHRVPKGRLSAVGVLVLF